MCNNWVNIQQVLLKTDLLKRSCWSLMTQVSSLTWIPYHSKKIIWKIGKTGKNGKKACIMFCHQSVNVLMKELYFLITLSALRFFFPYSWCVSQDLQFFYYINCSTRSAEVVIQRHLSLQITPPYFFFFFFCKNQNAKTSTILTEITMVYCYYLPKWSKYYYLFAYPSLASAINSWVTYNLYPPVSLPCPCIATKW